MRTKATVKSAAYASMFVLIALTSCQKNDVSDESATGTSVATSSTIAVSASATAAITDSVYLMQQCARGSKRDSIGGADLPAAVTNYLSSNYNGYVLNKAFAIHNSAAAITGYVAVVYYNDKPVGIEFDSAGNFLRVLEQREKGDVNGAGWHHGGRFHDRDRLGKDTVSLSALPAPVQTYMGSNYAADTLVKAFINHDSSLVILSKNNGLFATVFDATGAFVKRLNLPSKKGAAQIIEQAALPSGVSTYLNASYPNYVFKKAFVIKNGTAVAGYVVFIDANNTKYAVEFDVSGNFLVAKTIY